MKNKRTSRAKAFIKNGFLTVFGFLILTLTVWHLHPKELSTTTISTSSNMLQQLSRHLPVEKNERILQIQQMVDAIPLLARRNLEFCCQFRSENYELYDNISITTSMNESFIEKVVFKFMKQLQIRCPKQVRMGTVNDGGWDVCVAGPFSIMKPCLVYSFGMGGEWSFDWTMTKTHSCRDMAYDPSLGKPDHKPHPLLWFFNTGLGGNDTISDEKWRIRTFPALLQENNHSEESIDILKIDIESAEWESLITILAKPSCLYNVKQLMIEYHTRESNAGSQSSVVDLVTYWHIFRGLDKLGFKLWNVWNNNFCTFVSKRTPGLQLCGCFNAYYVNTRFL